MHRRKLILTGAAAAALALAPAGSAVAATPDRAEAPFVCPVLSVSDQARQRLARRRSRFARRQRLHRHLERQLTATPGAPLAR